MITIGLTQRVEWLADRGERCDCLDQRWAAWLEALGFRPVPIPNRLDDLTDYLAATGIRGVILTGGNDVPGIDQPRNPAPERDGLEARLIECCTERGTPLLGVCRGMQMLASYHGAKLTPVPGHVRRRHAINVPRGAIMPLQDGRSVNSFHDYGILDASRIGEDWNVSGHAPDGSIEAIAHRSHRLWGIMWHPERGPDPQDDDLLKAFFGESSTCDA